jgi:hypothetical protein
MSSPGSSSRRWPAATTPASRWQGGCAVAARIQVLDAGAVEPDVVRSPRVRKPRWGWPAPRSGRKAPVVRYAPGLGQQRFQRVPPVGNRGFRVGPPPTAPTPGAVEHWRTGRRPRPVLRREAYGLCASLPILRYQERGADRCAGCSRPAPNNRRPAVASWSASRQHGQPDRLGAHEMPTPFSTTRRRAVAEAVFTRPSPA